MGQPIFRSRSVTWLLAFFPPADPDGVFAVAASPQGWLVLLTPRGSIESREHRAILIMNELIEITVVCSSKAGDTQPGGPSGRPLKKRNTPVPLMAGQTAGGWDWRVDVPSHSKAFPFGMAASRSAVMNNIELYTELSLANLRGSARH